MQISPPGVEGSQHDLADRFSYLMRERAVKILYFLLITTESRFVKKAITLNYQGGGETRLSCPNPAHCIEHSNGKLLVGKIDDANGDRVIEKI